MYNNIALNGTFLRLEMFLITYILLTWKCNVYVLGY